MAYRMDSELARSVELLGSLDNFGAGVSVEDLFPELVDEAERVGIDYKDYEERIRKMGFLPCIEGIDPDCDMVFGEFYEEEDGLIDLIDLPVEVEDSDTLNDVFHPIFSRPEVFDFIHPEDRALVTLVSSQKSFLFAEACGLVPIMVIKGENKVEIIRRGNCLRK